MYLKVSNIAVSQIITHKIKGVEYWCQINYYNSVYVRKIRNIKILPTMSFLADKFVELVLFSI